MSTFAACFAIVVNTEGGLSVNPADPGNWTGGACGKGKLNGTKWGISAASYPDLDIAGLTQADAAALYQRDFWNRVGGDHLAGPLALLVFDSAVNSGVSRAVRWLQIAAGVNNPDGDIGPGTLAAVASHAGNGAALFAEVLAQRIVFDASLPTWRTFGLGWSRRLAKLAFQSLTVGA